MNPFQFKKFIAKPLTLFCATLSLTGCSALNDINVLLQPTAVKEVSATLTDKQFGEHLLKQIYPTAVWQKEYLRWELPPTTADDLESEISYSLKDIKTSQGEKRYVVITLSDRAGTAQELNLFRFKKGNNNDWILEVIRKINSENEYDPIVKELRVLGEAEITKIGNEQLGFIVTESDGGSGGEGKTSNLIYLSGNSIIPLKLECSSYSVRSSELDSSCSIKTKNDNSTFYPIELSYTLKKYAVMETDVGKKIPKGYEYSGGFYYRKLLATRKCKVTIPYDSAKNAYVIPATYEQARKSQDELAFWNYCNQK